MLRRACRQLWAAGGRTVSPRDNSGSAAPDLNRALLDTLLPSRGAHASSLPMGEPSLCPRNLSTRHSPGTNAWLQTDIRGLSPQRPWSHLAGAGSGPAPTAETRPLARGMAKLPFRLPRREPPVKRSEADGSTADSSTPNTQQAQAEELKPMTPQDMTNAMYLPWERRQFEGGKLTWWEKSYWVIFLLAGAAALASQMYNPWASTEGDEVLNEAIELRKKETSRAILLGKSFLDDEDPFEGLSPTQIQKYVEIQTGATVNDPFEGMTPEEIDEYVKNNA